MLDSGVAFWDNKQLCPRAIRACGVLFRIHHRLDLYLKSWGKMSDCPYQRSAFFKLLYILYLRNCGSFSQSNVVSSQRKLGNISAQTETSRLDRCTCASALIQHTQMPREWEVSCGCIRCPEASGSQCSRAVTYTSKHSTGREETVLQPSPTLDMSPRVTNEGHSHLNFLVNVHGNLFSNFPLGYITFRMSVAFTKTPKHDNKIHFQSLCWWSENELQRWNNAAIIFN